MTIVACAVSQDEVLLSWYQSEADVTWQKRARSEFELKRLGKPALLIANEGIRYFRYNLLKCVSDARPFFDVHPTSWFRASMNVVELGNCTAIDCWGRPDCRTVADIAMAQPALRECRATAASLEYPLILASASDADVAVLLDGYHRAAGLIHAREADPLPAYWAVCPGIADWGYYR